MQLASSHPNRLALAAITAAVLVSIAVVQQNIVLVSAVVIVALATLLPVEVSLGAFAFLAPFDYVLTIGRGENLVRVSWLGGAFAGAVLLVYGSITGRFTRPPRQALLWGLFVLWVSLSAAWAIDAESSLKRVPSMLALYGLYIVAVSFDISPRELSRVLMLAVAGGTVASIVLIYQAGLAGFQDRAALAFGGLEASPNELGASLILPFLLAFASFLSAGGLVKKAMPLAAMILIATAIFLTMSRGALVALAVAVMLVLFRVGIRIRVLLSLVVLALPLLFVPNLFFQRIKEAPFGRGTGRLDIWFAGAQIVKHNPILGTGLANFPLAYRQYAGYAPVFRGYDTGSGWSAHNAYLQALAETGLIGFVLLLSSIRSQMTTARAALRNPVSRDYRGIGIEAACWGVLVYGSSGYLEWGKFFWLVLILLTLIMRLQQRQRQLFFHSESLTYT